MNHERKLLDTVMHEMPFGFGWNFQTLNPGVHSFLFLSHMRLSLLFIVVVYQTVDASASFFSNLSILHEMNLSDVPLQLLKFVVREREGMGRFGKY